MSARDYFSAHEEHHVHDFASPPVPTNFGAAKRHASADGRPLCQKKGEVLLARTLGEVTCRTCRYRLLVSRRATQ